MHIHFLGVSGTGMGALAALFREAGHDVSGSDTSYDPPTGPALRAIGVRCFDGYDPKHLDPRPDLVVVGNVIRRSNPEAQEVERLDLPRTSMSAALRDNFLAKRRPLVVCGTHGKTTTSSMCAHLLVKAGLEPGWFIGGIPKSLPGAAAIGRTKRSLLGDGGPAPFVVEGDEYDAVYWVKRPKFIDYVGVGEDDVVIVTSCEFDHVDIYPDVAAYEKAFIDLARSVPEKGLIVCDAHDPRAREIVREHARSRVSFYALDGDDTGSVTPTWLGAPAPVDANGMQPFDLFVGGSSCGRYILPVPGTHNVRNAIAAIASAAEGFGVSERASRTALATFGGVKRRQDLLGEPGGVRVYDDFAHHPTAVDETLRALRARHPSGALWAVFEPRSATATRSVHQTDYPRSFGAADHVLLAPLGRANIPENERLDLDRVARDIGPRAEVMAGVDAIVDRLGREARGGDTVAVLSNGVFGGLHEKLLERLRARSV
jgi:UDP-N-acetylmuramate: L-alanyl-gamma-D-glutamyl-meso-diaminopimelate ligase